MKDASWVSGQKKLYRLVSQRITSDKAMLPFHYSLKPFLAIGVRKKTYRYIFDNYICHILVFFPGYFWRNRYPLSNLKLRTKRIRICSCINIVYGDNYASLYTHVLPHIVMSDRYFRSFSTVLRYIIVYVHFIFR